jgi:RHS repeat-associated protein
VRAKHILSSPFLSGALIVFGIATPVFGQVEEDPVTVPVRFSLTTEVVGNPSDGSGGSAGFWVNGYGNVVNTDYPEGVSFALSAQLVPGKTYTLSLTADNVWYGYWLYITGPAGYRVHIDDVERYGLVYSQQGQISVPASVTIRVDNGEGAPAGEASSLRPGRLIWTAGLGNLKNGQPAGVIALRQSNTTALSAADFQASALGYSPPSAEVKRYDGTGGNTGKYQIFANQCLAQVEPIGGGQEGFYLKFYSRYDVGTTISNGLWALTGPAFVEYTVQNTTPFSYGASAKLRITKINRLNNSGYSTENTRRTELRQVGGQPAGTYVWDVIDWTSNGVDGSGNLIAGETWSRWTYTNYGVNEDVCVYNGASQLASRVYNTYQSFAWGTELTQSIAGYGGSNPLTTTFAYHTNSNPGYWGSYSRPYYRIEPTGKWIRYSYYEWESSLGRVYKTYEPWCDAPTGPTAGDYTNGLVTTFQYTLDWAGAATRPSSIVRTVAGTTIAKTTIGYTDTSVTESVVYGGQSYNRTRYLVQATTQSYYNSSQYVTTVARVYREDAGMDMFQINGGQWVYEVTRGFLPGLPYDSTAADGSKQVWTYTRGERDPWYWGFTGTGEGSEWCIRQEQRGPSGLVAGLSTATSTVFAYDGTPVLTIQEAYTSSGWVNTGATRGYFLKGLVTEQLQTHGGDMFTNWTTQNFVWSGGQLVSTTDATGVEKQLAYDGKGRVMTERIVPITGQPQAGEQWIVHAYNGADQETSTTRTFNNTGGDAANDIVTEAFFDTAGRVTSTRAWGQSDWLTTSFSYNYGNYRTTLATAPGGGTTISEVYLDGRPKSVTGTAQAPSYFSYWAQTEGRIRTQQRLAASADGDGWMDTYTDWLGRVVEEVRPTTSGHTKDRRVYNSYGQLSERQLFDQNWSALLAPTRYTYGSMGQLTREGLDVNENGTLDDTGVDRVSIYSYDFVSLESAWWREMTTKVLTNPANGTDCAQTTVRERLTGRSATLQAESRTVDPNSQTTTEILYVDRGNKTAEQRTTVPGSGITAKKITKNGFLAQTISSEGVTTTLTYDVYGRLTKAQGRESVLDEKVYYPKSTLVQNLRNAVLKPSVIGTEWQILSYDSAGRLATHQTNNVGVWKTARYEYNAMGQVVHQWGDAATPVEYVYNTYGWRTNMRLYRNGSNWNASTWTSAVSGATADTTTWGYHMTTGLVTSKTDPANRTVNFTFNARNQLATRTWARGTVTTYGYFDASGYRTGELKQLSYSDGTPTVTYHHDDSGGTTGRTGEVRRIADATGTRSFGYRTNDRQLSYEKLDQTFFGSSQSTGREIWRAYDAQGRSAGFDCGWGVDHSAIQQVRYYFNDTSGGYQTGRVGQVYAWRSQAGGYTFTYTYRPSSNLIDNVQCGLYKRENQWQSWRNIPDYVRTYWDTTQKVNFHYDYDWLEQRIGEDHNDELATQLSYGGGIDTEYLFSQRGELDWVNATRMSGGTQIADRYRDWVYDNGGNRDYEYRSGTPNVDFVANNLNQYSSVGGTAYTYDNDGNLTGDGVWYFSWDGENRLKTANRVDSTLFIEFTYDYMNRRVSKVVRNQVFQLLSDRRFIHDGWNVIAELDGATSGMPVLQSFTWGLDMTGTVHGGGGVGGLLMIANGSAAHLPVYDANGNVRGLLNGSSGVWTAAYGYTAFGEVVQAAGTYAASNPIRFASKWYDGETGLYQHNHRYFSPRQGRFISRDPVAEDGGLNLYGYCGNNPVDHWDYIGTSWLSKAFRSIGKLFKKIWKPLVAVAVGVVTGGAALAAYYGTSFSTGIAALFTGKIATTVTLMSGAHVVGTTTIGVSIGVSGAAFGGAVAGFSAATTGAKLSGASWSDSLKAGLTGAATGAFTAGTLYGVNRAFSTWVSSVPKNATDPWLTWSRFGNQSANMLGRSAIRGVAAELMGGDFGSEFRRNLGWEGAYWGMDWLQEARYRFDVRKAGAYKVNMAYDSDQVAGPSWDRPEVNTALPKPAHGIGVVDIDFNNFGKSPGTDLGVRGWHVEGGRFSRFMAKIPGMHQISIYHDRIYSVLYSENLGPVSSVGNLLGNFGTMVPVAAFTYRRLGDQSLPFISGLDDMP